MEDFRALLANYREAVANVEGIPSGKYVPKGLRHRESQARKALANYHFWAIQKASK